VKERLAQRQREFDLLVNTKPSRVKEIVTEGRNKRFNEIERKFEFMRRVQEEQTQAKLRKDRFEKASMRFGNIQKIEDIDQAIEDLDAQHGDVVTGGASTLPALRGSKIPHSNRFTSPKLEEE
jgi:lipoate synthase